MRSPSPTLDQIKEALHEEGKTIIAAFDRELNMIRADIHRIEEKLDNHIVDNEKEFSGLRDSIQDLMGNLDKSTDQKIEKHVLEKHGVAAMV